MVVAMMIMRIWGRDHYELREDRPCHHGIVIIVTIDDDDDDDDHHVLLLRVVVVVVVITGSKGITWWSAPR